MEAKQSNKNLNVLKAPFEEWYLGKYTNALNELKYDDAPKEFLNAQGLSQKDFYKKYIQPFTDLDEKNLEIALKALCVNLRETTIARNYSYAICKQPRSSRRLNALQWLVPQIVDLKLFELPDKVEVYYKKPVRQCLYCGKPDFYIRNNKQVAFTESKHLCHHDNCDMVQTNLGDHDINCHYKIWKQKKKNLNQTIIRNSKFYNGDKWHDVNVDNKLIRTFLDFCDKQYEENLNIEYTIQYWAEMPGYPESRQFIEALHYSELL